MHDPFQVDVFIVLLMVAAAVVMAVKWIKLPYSIALVIVGLVMGVLHVLPPVEMTPHLILVVFLPALLFEASWNLHLDELKANWVPVSVLAIVGVVISMCVVGAIMHFCGWLSLAGALLFGAMISATDPISVVALFRKMGMDQRLTVLLEGESLFNDGTAVVLFNIILSGIIAGASFVLIDSIFKFFMVVAGGIAVGAAIGFLASRLTSYFEDHLLEITLTTIAAYGSYLVADKLGVSAVLSVVAAGIVLGNYGSRTAMSYTTRIAVNSFWEYAAFLVNSLVFLIIGLQIDCSLLSKYALPISVAIGAILAGRLLVIYGLAPLLSTRQAPISWAWRHVLFWGGLRGALCMALALSLPQQLPEREMIVVVTFGVVLFTLLIPGLTMEPLVKLLGMNPAPAASEETAADGPGESRQQEPPPQET